MTSAPAPRLRRLAALAAAGWACGASGQEFKSDARLASGQETRDPVAWVLAQAAQPAAGAASDPPARAPSSWVSRLMPFLDSSEPVGFVPPRWGGGVSYELLSQRASDEFSRYVNTATVSLAAASYFWQPWFAQVRGNLVLLGALENGAGKTEAPGERSQTRTLSVSGGGTATIFPASRFPFTATFDSSDSRASGEFAPSNYRSERLGLRQTWRSPLGETLYDASLDRSVLTSDSFGRDTILALNGGYLRTGEQHRFDSTIAWSRNRRSSGGDGSDLLRLSGRHSYRPSGELWVESLASFSGTDLAAQSSGENLSFTSRLSQLTTQGVWRPEAEERLVVTGGARALVSSAGSASTRTFSGNVGASFALTEEATFTGTVNTNLLSQKNAPDVFTTFATLGATYVSRPVDLRLATWSFGTGAEGSFQAGGAESGRYAAGAQADHQLSRNFTLGSASALNFLATQGAGVVEDSIRGRTVSIRHSGSAALRVATSETSEAFIGANVGQSDSSGGIEDRFRLANVQASGQLRFGAFDFLSMNLTAQWTRSRRDGAEAEESRQQLFGTIAYQHARLFGVPRLRFIASASFSDAFLDSRLLGNLEASRENVTRLIDQRLLYDIGRLELRLGMRIAKIEGRDDRQWYFRVNRQFGQF